MWRWVYQAVKQGKKIHQPLARASLMPKNVIQMISADEEPGKLCEVLQDVSAY